MRSLGWFHSDMTITDDHWYRKRAKPCGKLFRDGSMIQEYLYRDEFEGYVKEGVLSMHTAFSREQASQLACIMPSQFNSLLGQGPQDLRAA